jgi:Protein of unknown function (DUF2877)
VSTVVAIGAKAHAALVASGGIAEPLTLFPDAPYLDAGGEVIWVGSRLPAMHPRAVVTATPLPRGQTARFGELPGAWTPALPIHDARSAIGIVAACCRLRRNVAHLGVPRGFGALLAGTAPPFPLNFAVDRVRALAEAYRSDDIDTVERASRPLLGLGSGLTPSGDDLVGGALFGRLLRSGRPAEIAQWRAAGLRLANEAHRASHVISAALLSDLATGASFAPLHALAEALLRSDESAVRASAQTLCALGHSSGWDMLTGLVIGVTGAVTSDE